jgi:putative cell wall-binding protein
MLSTDYILIGGQRTMKPSLMLLTSFVVGTVAVGMATGLAEAAAPVASASVPAVTEAYFTTFTLSLTDPTTGQPAAGWVEFQNLPASAADTDYYVDYAAVPSGSPLPAYGQLGWSELGPNQVGSPFYVQGSATVEVLAYDNEAQGDDDGSDQGQRIGVAVSTSSSGPFSAAPAIPVTPATLTAQPSSVTVGSATAVTFTLRSATGNPLAGYAVQPEQGTSPSGVTNAQGQVTLTVNASAPGTLAFWAEDDADNGNNLAGIQYAGPYAVAQLTVAPASSPAPASPVTAILARDDLPFDALVGQILADRYGWPVYLTPPASLPADLIQTFKATHVTRIVILGGPVAVSPQIADTLESMGMGLERLWGWDRYGTAAAVARFEGDPSGIAVVTGGLDYHDLLSVAAVAGQRQWPIFLANQQGLPLPELEAVTADHVHVAYVVGSLQSVDARAIAQLTHLGVHVVRISGNVPGPYDTEAALITSFEHSLSWRTVYVTSGASFLAGVESSPAVARAGTMLVQVPSSGTLPPVLETALAAIRGQADGIETVAGTPAIAPEVLHAVQQALGL